jgi:hypothetical protein
VVRRALATLRVTLVAEITVGWLMAVTHLSVAWWAPVLCVVVILAVWDAHDRREALHHDPMTGLLNDAGMEPQLPRSPAPAITGIGSRRRCCRRIYQQWHIR